MSNGTQPAPGGGSDKVAPGATTSEFGVVVLGAITAITAALTSPSAMVQATAIASLAAIASAYILGRSWTKASR